MPSAWDLAEQKRVMCGVIHVETSTVAWSLGLRKLLPLSMPIACVSGQPFDMSRNSLCRACIEQGFDWLFFLDSDVVAPPDAVLRLMAHNKPFISGVYHRRSPPHGLPVMIKNGNWVQQYRPGELLEVDMVGAGCLLISRQLLETIPPQDLAHPWFWWKVDMKEKWRHDITPAMLDGNGCTSEDFSLCQHYRNLGGKVLVDTSVQCRHIGFAEAVSGAMIPCHTG